MRIPKKMLLPWLGVQDLIRLLLVSKEWRDCEYFRGARLSIPWEYYSLFDKRAMYYSVKDYLLLRYLKENFENATKINFSVIHYLISNLKLVQLITDSEHRVGIFEQQKLLWDEVLAVVTRSHHGMQTQYADEIKSRLIQYKSANADRQLTKIEELFSQKSNIVVSFDSAFMNADAKQILNFFQTRGRKNFYKQGSPEYMNYVIDRLAAEALHFLNAEIPQLQRLLLNPDAHPCYATLQIQIAPITEYGKSFIILDPVIKKQASAIFGAPLNRMKTTGVRFKPVKLSESLAPLIAQFSEDLLKVSMKVDSNTPFPADFDMQFKVDKSEYIEVQIPASIPLRDPRYVRHIHFAFGVGFPEIEKLNEFIKQDITVSIGENPFIDPIFTDSYHTGKIQKFLLETVTNYIYKAALFIAETDEEHLGFKCDEKSLQFSFKITQNRPNFHQAQAAALVYLMGVRDYFRNISALAFPHGMTKYILPLNGFAAAAGELGDHDAYTYDYLSLKKLLAVFLKRIFSIIIVSHQNESHWLLDNSPHPITGKGATEESNQTRELYLGTEMYSYDIAVNWMYDRVVIEVLSDQSIYADFVLNCIVAAIGKKASQENFFIYINLSLTELLNELHQKCFAYQACVIYENVKVGVPRKTDGNLLLAYRDGYATPGGHNNDPYSWIGPFTEIEFGDLRPDWQDIYRRHRFLGVSQQPLTAYFSLPTECFSFIKEDVSEFSENSLNRFPIYRLGNLPKKAISQCRGFLQITKQEYSQYFSKALPLRPVNSIIVYLDWAERKLSRKLNELYSNLAQFTVKICHEYTVVNFHGREFWKPHVQFGRIEISGKYYYLKILKKYFRKFRALSVNKLINHSLFLTAASPDDLLETIKNIDDSFIKNDSFLVEKLFTELKENQSNYLSQFKSEKIVRILMIADEMGFVLTEYFQRMENLLTLVDGYLSIFRREQKNIHETAFFKKIIDKSSNQVWGDEQKTILHIAAEKCDLSAVGCLVKIAGINPNVQDKNGDTPLHYACIRGYTDLSIYLCEKMGANLFCRNNQRQSIFYVAALHQRWEVILKILHCSRSGFNIKNSESKEDLEIEAKSHPEKYTILHLILSMYHVEPTPFLIIFYLLLKLFNPAINMSDQSQMTVLHLAAKFNIHSIIESLIDAKGDVTSKNRDGQTPLHIAVANDHAKVVKILIEKGKASICEPDSHGITPRLLAAETKNEEIRGIFRFYDSALFAQVCTFAFFEKINYLVLKKMIPETMSCLSGNPADFLKKLDESKAKLERLSEVIKDCNRAERNKYKALFNPQRKKTHPHVLKFLFEEQLKPHSRMTKRQAYNRLRDMGFFYFFKDPPTARKTAFRLISESNSRSEYQAEIRNLTNKF